MRWKNIDGTFISKYRRIRFREDGCFDFFRKKQCPLKLIAMETTEAWQASGAPNENIVQNHLNITLANIVERILVFER